MPVRWALTVAALGSVVAGCSSGSGHQAVPAAPTPTATASPVDTPVIDAETQGLDSLTGKATVTLGTGSPATLTTAGGPPGAVSVDTAGKLRVEVSMRGKGGGLLSLAGPAAVGPVTGDHVALFLPSAGLLLDTKDGNTCMVTYSKAAESGVAGIARCDAENGTQRYTVTIDFRLR